MRFTILLPILLLTVACDTGGSSSSSQTYDDTDDADVSVCAAARERLTSCDGMGDVGTEPPPCDALAHAVAQCILDSDAPDVCDALTDVGSDLTLCIAVVSEGSDMGGADGG